MVRDKPVWDGGSCQKKYKKLLETVPSLLNHERLAGDGVWRLDSVEFQT